VESWSRTTHRAGRGASAASVWARAAAGASSRPAARPTPAAAAIRRTAVCFRRLIGRVTEGLLGSSWRGRGRSVRRSGGGVVEEDGLDGAPEDAGDAEGQRQGRIVLAGLDGVDGLARDAQARGQVALAPAPLGAQHFQMIAHGLTDAAATRWPTPRRSPAPAAADSRTGR